MPSVDAISSVSRGFRRTSIRAILIVLGPCLRAPSNSRATARSPAGIFEVTTKRRFSERTQANLWGPMGSDNSAMELSIFGSFGLRPYVRAHAG